MFFHFPFLWKQQRKQQLFLIASRNRLRVYPYTICFWLELRVGESGEKKLCKVKTFTKKTKMFHIWQQYHKNDSRWRKMKITLWDSLWTILYEKFSEKRFRLFQWEKAHFVFWCENFQQCWMFSHVFNVLWCFCRYFPLKTFALLQILHSTLITLKSLIKRRNLSRDKIDNE